MSNGNHGLRFDIYERVHLPENVAAIEELEEIELVPRIQVIDQGENAVLQGQLVLNGIYRAQGSEDEQVALEHWIPVEITLPMNRVTRLDEVTVDIDTFDVVLLSSRALNLTGILSLRGISLEEEQEDHGWNADVFTVSHSSEEQDEESLAFIGAQSDAYPFRSETQHEANAGVDANMEVEEERAANYQGAYRQFNEQAGHPLYAEAATEIEQTERSHRASFYAHGEPSQFELQEAAREQSLFIQQSEQLAQSAESLEEQVQIDDEEMSYEQRLAQHYEQRYEQHHADLHAQQQYQMDEEERYQLQAQQQYQQHAEHYSRQQDVEQHSHQQHAEHYSHQQGVEQYSREQGVEQHSHHQDVDQYGQQLDSQYEPLVELASDNEEQREQQWSQWETVELQEASAEGSEQEQLGLAEVGDDYIQSALESREDTEGPVDSTEAAMNEAQAQREVHIALNGNTAQNEAQGLRTILNSSLREQAAQQAANLQQQQVELQKQQREQEEKQRASEDDIEWQQLFLNKRPEQNEFKRIRMCIVQREDTLEQIANKYSVNPRELLLRNNLHESAITEGQLLYIP